MSQPPRPPRPYTPPQQPRLPGAPPPRLPNPVPFVINDINAAQRLLSQFTLPDPELRRQAIRLFSRARVSVPNLPELLWYSPGVIYALLLEFVGAHQILLTRPLSLEESYNVVEAINLLQIVAAHPDTRIPFLDAATHMYLYPFMNCRDQSPATLTLMLASLNVISELIKVDDIRVVNILLQEEIVPLCLVTVDFGDESIRLVATFILYRLILSDAGLMHICIEPDRMHAVIGTTCRALMAPSQPTPMLLKNIMLCYIRLADDSRAIHFLKVWLPILIHDPTFLACSRSDESSWQFLAELLPKAGI